MRKCWVWLWLALLCLGAFDLWAQPADPARSFDAATLGDRVMLDHGWLFHAGDDPSWASPQLDDRDWKAIDIHKPLSDYGVAPDLQYCWMRLHVFIPNGTYPPLALSMQGLVGSYQIYVDDRLIAEAGKMTDHSWSTHTEVTRPLTLGVNRNEASKNMLIALRFALVRTVVAEKPPQSPFSRGYSLLGSQRYLAFADARDTEDALVKFWTSAIPALIVGLVAFGLFLYPPRSAFFGWLSLSYLAQFGGSIAVLSEIFTGVTRASYTFVIVFSTLEAIGLVLLSWTFLQFRRAWLSVGLTIPTLIASACELAWTYGFRLHSTSSGGVVSFLGDLCTPLSTSLLLWAAMRGRREAKILLLGSFLVCSSSLLVFARQLGWIAFDPRVYSYPNIPSYQDITRLLNIVNVLVFFTLYVVRAARQSYRAKAELAAAQTVQQLLLVDDVPESENFSVHASYLPANEVGGDFFLVSPGPDGSLTALVGDVAGKGLQAAMRVSMIVGALRREVAREPAVILNNLNGVLLAEKVRGFTTVCCVHLRADGTLLVANAGHLSPVIVGGGGAAREMETEPALPLGFAAEPVPQTAACLQPGERLMLCSDGVPEARDRKTRELMGFGRMLELAGESAESIAQAAKKFGQEDDITVLTIALR